MVFVRYFISGGTATVVHFAVLAGLVELFKINPTIASATGFCAAVLVNYTLQYYWTFKAQGAHAATFVRYIGVTLLTLVINTVLFWLMNVQFGFGYLVAQAIATLTVLGINFYVNQRFTFAFSLPAREQGEVG